MGSNQSMSASNTDPEQHLFFSVGLRVVCPFSRMLSGRIGKGADVRDRNLFFEGQGASTVWLAASRKSITIQDIAAHQATCVRNSSQGRIPKPYPRQAKAKCIHRSAVEGGGGKLPSEPFFVPSVQIFSSTLSRHHKMAEFGLVTHIPQEQAAAKDDISPQLITKRHHL